MKPKLTFSLVLIALLALAVPFSATAKKKATPTPSPAASPSPTATAAAMKKPRSIPYHGKIGAVDAAAKTFTVGSRTFRITSETTITKSGSPAGINDIVVGEEVRGSYWKHDDGSLDARSVKLGPKEASGASMNLQKKEKPAASPNP